MIRSFLVSTIFVVPAIAVPPYPTDDGINKDDSRFVMWASGYRNYDWGTNVSNTWKTPAKAYGKATEDVMDIVCLGDNGRITMYFPHPIKDGPGPDFAVFENSFSPNFLELAFVEVSSDGVNFFRFENDSLTPTASNSILAHNLNGLAGKYMSGEGTPFDLADLDASPTLDVSNVRFVRLIDIFGNGSVKDSSGDPIYDPYPNIGSAGFDLDAIGVIHRNDGNFQMLASRINGTNFEIEWASNPGSSYVVQKSVDLAEWLPVQTIVGDPTDGATFFSVAKPEDAQYFWRVLRAD